MEPSTGPNGTAALLDGSLRAAVESSEFKILSRDTIAKLVRHATEYPLTPS